MIVNQKEKLFIPLNLKVAISLILGLVLAFGVFIGLNRLESFMEKTYYTSPQAYTKSLDDNFKDFRAYVRKNKVSADDQEAIQRWLESYPYTYIVIYDNYSGHFEDGWIAEGDVRPKKLETAKTTITDKTDKDRGPRLDREKHQHGNDRIVQFADEDYYVYMEVYKEEGFRKIMTIVELIVAFVVLLVVVMAFTTKITRRIGNISRDLTNANSGEINSEIRAKGRDEISIMAESINQMRQSLLERLEGERAAWDANRELITSMSHDIRTPLTSIIGYLDIIEGGKYKSEEELHQFVQACRNKSFQLKDLSDKLFQYFLVFCGAKNKQNLEVMDGNVLFQQLITEHVAELISYGYKVKLDYDIPEMLIETDVSSLRRLFDNIFSNIMKYADRTKRIYIKATVSDGVDDSAGNSFFNIKLENDIARDAKKVESTKIGVRTCEKITKDLGGSFTWYEGETKYITDMLLPVFQEEATLQKDGMPIDLECSLHQTTE